MPPRSFHNFISTCLSIYELGSVVLRSSFTVSYERQLGGLWAFWNAGRVGRLIGGNGQRGLVKSVNIGFYDGRHVKEKHYLRLQMNLLCNLLSSFPNVSSLRIAQVVFPISILRVLLLRWVGLKTLEARYFKDVRVPAGPIVSMSHIPLETRLDRLVFLPGTSQSLDGAENFLLEVMEWCEVKSCVLDWTTLECVLRKSPLSRPRTLKTVVLGPPSPWLYPGRVQWGGTGLFEKLGWLASGRSKLKLLNFRACVTQSCTQADIRVTNFVGSPTMFDEWVYHFPEEATVRYLAVEEASSKWLLQMTQHVSLAKYLERLTIRSIVSVESSSDIGRAVGKLSRLSELRVSISAKLNIPITVVAGKIIAHSPNLESLWCKYENGPTVDCEAGWEMLGNCGLLDANGKALTEICLDNFYIWIKTADGEWERREGQLSGGVHDSADTNTTFN
ncbi:hypothetical protein PQX77_007988 [Marasmius sp. AFHP31]|nr:hypothetical protein PQX77_007988 [Marasmius sp. AFHP31]